MLGFVGEGGHSSATFEKTPYRVEFWDNDNDDADHPVLGMPADSDWVLRGPFTDKSLIREAFVHDLGRETGLRAPRYAFAELCLNTDAGPAGAGDYMGVYMIVETIKNSKDRLDLEQLDEDDRGQPPISGWTVNRAWPGSQTVTRLRGGGRSGSGSNVTVRNESWNGSIAAGVSTTFGFTAGGSSATPVATCAGPRPHRSRPAERRGPAGTKSPRNLGVQVGDRFPVRAPASERAEGVERSGRRRSTRPG